MIACLRRMARTERSRVLLISVAMTVWMFLLVVVYEQIGADAFKGTQDAGAISRGFDIRDFIDPDRVFANLIGLAMTHPLFLAIAGTIAIGLGARSCAGELQAGTLELTLSRRLSRTRFLVSYALFIALALALLMAIAAVVVLAAQSLLDTSGRIGVAAMLQAAAHGWLLFCSLAALAMLISTWSRSRSAAFTGSLAMLVAAYFLEFFSRLWTDIEALGRLSPFHYFLPTDTLLGEGVARGDALVLAATTAVALGAAIIRFERRDL